jgi:uncharacterized protein YjgD (DUF1641 family)
MESNQNGAALLQLRLNDPQTADTLNRLLDRIDSLEATVGRLADVVEQAPGFTAMVGDMADETVRQAAANGVDIEERLQTALALAEKLTAPKTAEKIDQLLAMADEAPGLAAMVGDMIDDTQRKAAANGIDIEARVSAGLGLAEKLTHPNTVQQLNQLLEMADTAPGFIAMVGDMADEAYRNALAQGIDLESLISQGKTAASKLSILMESGILDDGALNVVGATGKALARASREPVQPVGLMGMLSALRDPDTQHALGFLLNVSQKLGQELK